MDNTLKIRGEVESFLQQRLDERLARLTSEQRGKFDRIFPAPIPASRLEAAIDLCDRALRSSN
jgi:hypothetical protein